MSYKVEVKTVRDPKWYSNQIVFGSRVEAERYGRDLFLRWTATDEWRVVEVDDVAPNYRLVDNALERIG